MAWIDLGNREINKAINHTDVLMSMTTAMYAVS